MRILLIADAPWLYTASALQVKELAKRLQADLHTVFWMPQRGFAEGGTTVHDGIMVLPGDDELGNHISQWHAQTEAIDFVISRGDASRLDHYGGTRYAWIAWQPGDVQRRILRKAVKCVAGTQAECDELTENGLTPVLIPRGVAKEFRPSADGATFKTEGLGLPADAFLVSMAGVTNPHWQRALEAFAPFRSRHEDAYIYLHTDPERPIALGEYAAKIGIPPDAIRVPSPYTLYRGADNDFLARMYVASDVHLVPGRAIQPILEAQVCGTPVLTTDRPEIAEAMSIEGLGAKVPPITYVETEPLLDVDAWTAELENAYAMTVDQRDNHSKVCQLVGKLTSWDSIYEKGWKPLLAMLQEEEEARQEMPQLAGTETEKDKRDSKFLEDRGDIVRKYETGGNEHDEAEQNAAIIAAGPHPNVIPIIEEGRTEQGRYWFDTPKGVPLSEMSDFSGKDAAHILDGLTAGLKHLHEHGIAHRDISPRNVLMINGEPVIFDFDWALPGLDRQTAWMCDYDPLNPLVMEYAVPVMANGLATRGFHRVVTHVHNLPESCATSKPDVPYQQIGGTGERDCDARWTVLAPDVAGKRVLDLGCNLGYFAARALDEGAASVLAVDRDEGILAGARILHPSLDGNAQQLNLDDTLPEGEFDVGFCLSVWQHLKVGRPGLLEYLKTIPVVYWEDANLTKPELEQVGFGVERIGASERGRNLFKLTSKEKVHATS